MTSSARGRKHHEPEDSYMIGWPACFCHVMSTMAAHTWIVQQSCYRRPDMERNAASAMRMHKLDINCTLDSGCVCTLHQHPSFCRTTAHPLFLLLLCFLLHLLSTCICSSFRTS